MRATRTKFPSGFTESVASRLAGRKIDVVGFVDALLEIAKNVSEIRCSLSGDSGLRFEFGQQETCEVELDGCRGKLRMLCARLSVLCGEAPYGGEGSICVHPNNGNGDAESHWMVRFKNTPDEHEFTVVFVGVENAQIASGRRSET